MTSPRGKRKPPPAAVALLSGGMDSAVACVLHLASGGRIPLALTFDYGQRAAARERTAARRLCRELRIAHRTVALRWLGALGGNALTDPAREIPDPGAARIPGGRARRTAAAVWVPARNAVFVACAAAFAESLSAGAVLAGFNRDEAETFPDNSAEFTAAASAFLSLGTRNHVRVVAPTQRLTKRELAAATLRLRIPRALLWSCYRGGRTPCGTCESCRRQERAFAEAARR